MKKMKAETKGWVALAIIAAAGLSLTKWEFNRIDRANEERANGYTTAIEQMASEQVGHLQMTQKIEDRYANLFSARGFIANTEYFRGDSGYPGDFEQYRLPNLGCRDEVREDLLARVNGAITSVEDAIQSAFPK